MLTGIIGKKIGMTQVFAEDGVLSPATVLKAGPCVVVQRKTADRDGYDSVQLGLVEEKPARVNRPVAGHYKRANVPPTRIRREVPLGPGSSDGEDDTPKEGEQVLASLFAEGDQVDVVGISRGRGFQGVVKRHGFRGGRATHGSMFHRAPGSIGQSSYPSRVMKGMRGPGRMGGDRVTVRNLRVIQVNADTHTVVVRGAVPGAPGGYLVIRKAVAPRRQVVAPAPDTGKKKR
jgi:large subunit ribosomal protein L3